MGRRTRIRGYGPDLQQRLVLVLAVQDQTYFPSASGRTENLKFQSLHARRLQKIRDMKQIKQHFTESSFIKKLHILKRVKVLLDPSGISKGYIL